MASLTASAEGVSANAGLSSIIVISPLSIGVGSAFTSVAETKYVIISKDTFTHLNEQNFLTVSVDVQINQ